MKDDWEKLSYAECEKVRDLAANNWEDIQVFIQNFDKREGKHHNKCSYGTLLIKWRVGTREFQTVIARHDSGHMTKNKR